MIEHKIIELLYSVVLCFYIDLIAKGNKFIYNINSDVDEKY